MTGLGVRSPLRVPGWAGVPPAVQPDFAAIRVEFGVPEEYTPVGAITVGHRTSDPGAAGSPARRPRRPVDEVVHRGTW